jgi:hypothetical protein
MNEQNEKQEQEAGTCGPGCNCGSSGLGKRAKWLICSVVVVAAGVTAATHAVRLNAAESQQKQTDYSTAIPGVAATNAVKPAVELAGWGAPLMTLAELNTVATNTEAVFVVVPSTDDARTAAIQKEVTGAAATMARKGTKIGTFLLSWDAQEYAGLVEQVGSPAVLAMVKGRGTAVVKDKEVTQEGLLKAYVGASRPSSCCGSGCGSGGCK